jgi:preprotein translocase subunit YajC
MPYLTVLPALLVGQAADAGGPLAAVTGILPFVLMFGVVYFLVLRPASKQRLEHQQLLSNLKKDDEIVTQSGIYGRIVVLEERVVTLEVADRVKIKVLRNQIAGPWKAALIGAEPRPGVASPAS